MAKTLPNGKIQIEAKDTLYGIYGPNWKALSGYTGDPTKLQIGTILPAPSIAKTTFGPTEAPYVTPLVTGNVGSTPSVIPIDQKTTTKPPEGTTPTGSTGVLPPVSGGKMVNIGTTEAPLMVPEGSEAHRNWLIQQMKTTQSQVEEIKKQQEALAKSGLTDTKDLMKDASGNWVPKVSILPEEKDNVFIDTEAENARIKKEEADRKAKEQQDLIDKQNEATKLATQKTIADLKASLGIVDTTKPVTPTYASDYEALRSSEGLSGIESQINNINKEMNDLEASYKAGLVKQGERLAPMEIIGGKQTQLKEQYESQLESLNNRKKTLVDEYNIKTGIVDNIMKFKQLDYGTASDEYNTKFDQTIKLQSLLMSVEDKANAESNRVRDDARANLTILQNMVKDSGQTWDTLTDDMKSQMTREELRAGIPSGTMEAFMTAMPEVEVSYMTTSYNAEGQQVAEFWGKKDGKGVLLNSVVGSGVKETTADKTALKQAEFDTAKAYVAANITASDAELSAALRRDTNILTDGDISTIIKEAKGKQKYITIDWLKSFVDDATLRAKAKVSFGSMWHGSDWEVNQLLTKTMEYVEGQRKLGLTDDEIKKDKMVSYLLTK